MTTTREAHLATVVDNDDPEKRFRIKVASASLMGVDDNGEAVEYGDWIEPSFPVLFGDGEGVTGGLFVVPGPGTQVEVEVVAGSAFDQSPGQSGVSNSDPRWRASVLQLGDSIPEEFARNYPARFGFRSATGHVFLLDDSDGGEGKVLLAARPNASGRSSFLSLEGDGSIQVVANNGAMIYLNAAKNELTVLDPNGNMLAFKPDGLTIMAKGNTINLGEGGVSIVANGDVFLQGNSITLSANAIALGSVAAAVPIAKSDLSPSTVVKVLA